jgi:type IV pilus assembly protein PilM
MTRTVVGLDIGSSGVRAAEFAVGRRSTLRKFAAVTLPEGVIRAGLVMDAEALTDALKELWSQGKFSTKSVVVGIANDAVLVRQMDLEWMPPADFRKGLRYQVADALPVPVDEANLDYYMLEEIEQPGTGDGDPRKIARVMLVAAGREMVDSFVRAVQAAGLRPVSVDLLPFALVRAVGPVDRPDAPLEAVVDIGADTVVVVVHQGGRPRFVRTLAGHGGQTITRDLMERYDWTWEEAERTKIVLGLPGLPGLSGRDMLKAYAAGDLAPDLDEHPAREAIAEHVDRLGHELRATLDYFRTSAAGVDELSRVLLTGRASELGGLAETLATRLELPVERLSVLGLIHKPRRMMLLDEQETSLAVPAGLCLGAAAS